MNRPFDDDALRHAAGDQAAGDLDPAEAARFRALAAAEPAVAEDLVFWQGLRPAWTDAASTDALGSGFADSVLARAAREPVGAPTATVLRLPWWASLAGATAAAALLVVVLLPRAAPEAEMYAEDGATVLPATSWERYLPRAMVSHVDLARPMAHDAGVPPTRAWAGLWTRPVRVASGARDGDGHLVLRIAGGSPADRAGLRPGDIIRSICKCPVFTAACIAHALEAVRPGERVPVDWWRPATGEQFQATMVMEALYE